MVTLIEEQKYLRNLPLLHFTSSLYPEVDLSKIYIICAQHLASTTYSLFHLLIQLGLKPENLSVIGKCYSTDPQVFRQMKALGIDVCESSHAFNSHTSFDKQYRANIKKFVADRAQKLKSKQFNKIIILDDGGELIPVASRLIGKNSDAIGIEQTSSGYHKLKKNIPDLPIINVARSPAKLNYESPIIAELVLNTLLKHIKDLNLKPGKALIIGNGPIGAHIKEALKRTHKVYIYDQQTTKTDIKKSELDGSLKEFDLIIGCTGKPILSTKQQKLLKKNTVLVSASSSDREFNAVDLRKNAPKVSNCHKNLFIDGKWLINCGFPINFSEHYRDIDCDELQLTRSLLLSSILQAVTETDFPKKGFVPLDLEVQRDIVKKFSSIFSNKEQKEKVALAI